MTPIWSPRMNLVHLTCFHGNSFIHDESKTTRSHVLGHFIESHIHTISLISIQEASSTFFMTSPQVIDTKLDTFMAEFCKK